MSFDIQLGADLGAIRRELAKLPNMTAEESQRMLIELEKSVRKAEKAAKQATRSTRRAQREAARAAEKASRDAQGGFRGLIELAGVSSRDITKVGKVFAALASPVGIATVGITGFALALGGGVAGITAAVLAADEFQEALKPFEKLEGFEGIPDEARASIEAANNAVASLEYILKQAVVTLGAEFAPTVEQVAMILVKAGLMGLDAFQGMADGGDLARRALRELLVWMTDSFVQGLTSPISQVMNMVSVLGGLASAVGADGIGSKLSALDDQWDSFTRSIAETAVDAWGLHDALVDGAAAGIQRLDDATSDYDARARELVETVGRVTAKTKGSGKAHEDAARAAEKEAAALAKLERQQLEAAEAATDLVDQATRHRLTAIEEIQRAERDALAELQAITQKRLDLAEHDAAQRMAIHRDYEAQRALLQQEFATQRRELEADALAEQRAQAMEVVDAVRQNISDVLGSMADLAAGWETEHADRISALQDRLVEGEGRLSEAQKRRIKSQIAEERKGAKQAHSIQQAAAVADVLMNTAAGITDVWSKWAALPPIAIALSSGVAAVGAIQLGVVKQQQPSFHTGGMVGRSANAAPDEVTARLLTGEGVLSRAGVAAVGGPGGVDAINRSGARSGQIVIIQKYKHRVFDAVVEDSVRRDSPLAQAIRADTRVGHRRNS